ncbi:MAG: glycosyltransferase [Paraglaciecola sp.]|uniref:glycosyltransferase n=1 Tax=Paraglaciecola sp. TaxID=1920173 RepID=UPI0032981345
MLNISQTLLRKECDIISTWDDKNNIKVSILCATFNQDSYIEDAIKGFLLQETTFAYEIIVHDDASSDNTPHIIKKYQALYPNIIKPIIQTENQFSKGNFKPSAYMAKLANGLYSCLCEGDDYWIDKNKLESQFKALENNKNINLCVHDAFTINQKDGTLSNKFPKRKNREYIIPFKKIFTTSGQFSPTASMMIRTNVIQNLPAFFMTAPVGDFFLEVIAGRNGIYYLPQKMSVYRNETVGSWSIQVLKKAKNRIEMYKAYLSSLNELKTYLTEQEAIFVKYKIQMIYNRLAIAYLSVNDRKLALKYYIYSFRGQFRTKDNIIFIAEFLGFDHIFRVKLKKLLQSLRVSR